MLYSRGAERRKMNRKPQKPRLSKPRRKKTPQALHPEVLPAEAENDEENSDSGAEPEVDDTEAYSNTREVAKLGESPDSDEELRAISPGDPLRRYLEEVRRYPLIDAQQELALAMKLRESGDLDAARALVQA